MQQALEFVISNPETTRLLLQYGWIAITVLTPIVTCLCSLLGCCLPCFRSGFGGAGGGGGGVGGAACNCCPQVQQTPSSTDVESGSGGGEPKPANRYEYNIPVVASDPSTGRRRTVGPVICCCLIVLLVLAVFGFVGAYSFLISIHSVD
jgi:hypothetical protein